MAFTKKTLTVTVTPPPVQNFPPVWTYTSVKFTQGTAGTLLVSSMVSDATGPVVITMTGSGPAGVTWNNTLKRFEYDGVGVVAQSSWSGSASDGVNPPVVAAVTVAVVAPATLSIPQWKLTTVPLTFSATVALPNLPPRTKHARWVRHPPSGCWYIFGGDYPHESAFGMTAGEGGINATLKYNPVTRAWSSEYPFCGKPGQYYSAGHDETAVCWDTSRSKFWVTDGYQSMTQTCAFDGGVTMGIPLNYVVATFDPATQDWALPFGTTKLFYFKTFNTAQHMRSVYDPVGDRIIGPAYSGGPGTALIYFNCATGAWSSGGITGIGNVFPSTGQTVHLFGTKIIFVGYQGSSSPNNRRLFEVDINTRVARVLAEIPYGMYDDQDNSYVEPLNSILIWSTHPNVYSWLVNRTTGAVTPGPPSPIFNDGLPMRPQHNNYDPGTGKVLIGWSQAEDALDVNGNPKHLPQFWEYEIDPAPSWLPASGNVKTITTDAYGMPVNDLWSQRPSDYSSAANYFGTSGVGFTALTRAWASAAYARDYSANGAILIENGGDGDYYGTEVYAFDFTDRRWSRLCEPHRNMTGSSVSGDPHWGAQNDYLKPTTDPNYFSRVECEHGPLVAPDVVGLLPITPVPTTPGCPHTYDGLIWMPGSVVGNRRGALLRPCSTYIYNSSSTTRAHYFDLDAKRWGRFSNRMPDPFVAKLPTCCYDAQTGRVLHSYGYLDLATRTQVSRTWSGIPYSTSGELDVNRRLWVHPTNNGFNPDTNPGGLNAINADTGAVTALTLIDAPGSTRWMRQFGYCAAMVWCPDLDCFFFYNAGTQGFGYQRQKIWRIEPPISSPLTNAWQVTEITMPGDTVTGDTPGIGSFKRCMWISSIKCLAIVNGPPSGGKVFLYRPLGI